jgi:hypothetical protein
MSLNQLSKYVDKKREALGISNDNRLQSINSSTPFWLWKEPDHYKASRESCDCFTHQIGLPIKDGMPMPYLPYQYTIFKALQDHKCLFIKKSRGIGCTEFLLRYLLYSCVTGKLGKNNRACIVTGPRIDLAIDLISRFKGLILSSPFASSDPNDRTQNTMTMVMINTIRVEAFPSHTISAARGLVGVRWIHSDESDFYPRGQQKEVRAVLEGYIGKPNADPHIIMVSTPKSPGGLMEQIELESNSIYHKLFFDYHYGLEGPRPIYSLAQIKQNMRSPEWPREYLLQYLGESGNVFSSYSIEQCQKTTYNPDEVIPSHFSAGVDPSYGSSNFAIVATRMVNGKIQVIVAEEYSRDDADFNSMISRINQIKQKHGITACFVDSAAPEIWTEIKRVVFHEEYRNNLVQDKIKMAEDYGFAATKYMRCLPVAFSKHAGPMLQHAKSLMDENRIMIDKRFDKLLISLRTAVAEESKLQKSDMSYDDLFDSFRLALTFYRRGK